MKNWKSEVATYAAGWLEKASVGCLVVGLFQPDHIVGGVLGSVFFFVTGLIIKIRGGKQ